MSRLDAAIRAQLGRVLIASLAWWIIVGVVGWQMASWLGPPLDVGYVGVGAIVVTLATVWVWRVMRRLGAVVARRP